MPLFGWSLGCLFIPRLADLKGRRSIFLIASLVSIPIYIAIILTRSLNFTLALNFLLGLTNPGKISIGYVYLLELIPAAWQTYAGTAFLIADGTTTVLVALYFRYISKDWLWFQVFFFSLMTLATLACFLVPESPKYLYGYRKFRYARAALDKIAWFNGVPNRNTKYRFDVEDGTHDVINVNCTVATGSLFPDTETVRTSADKVDGSLRKLVKTPRHL